MIFVACGKAQFDNDKDVHHAIKRLRKDCVTSQLVC